MHPVIIRLPILGNEHGRIMEVFPKGPVNVEQELCRMLARYETVIPFAGTAEVYELSTANRPTSLIDYRKTGLTNWELSAERDSRQLPLFPGK